MPSILGLFGAELVTVAMSSLLLKARSLSRISKSTVSSSSSVAARRQKLVHNRALSSSLLQRSLAIQTRSFHLSVRPRARQNGSREEPDLHKLTDEEYVAHQLPPELYVAIFFNS